MSSSAILREHQQNPNVPVTQLFTRKELVGKGAYGGVYKGVHNATGQVVALKIIDLDTPDDDITEIQREVQLLSEMRDAARHNITLYHGSYLHKTELWIVMDFASGGSIRTLMKSGKIEEKYIVLIVREVLVAMDFLHRQGIIHRDIKAANILLTQVGRIMLADFGVAAHLQTNNKRSTFIGTPLWMAPEVITDGKLYDTKADIWSLGITLYEIATGNPPYFGMEPLRACALIPRQTPARLEGGNWSPAMRDFLAACLQINPEDRPTADELSRHRWIKAANKLSMAMLKELIGRYVKWFQMGGQRASLVGMDSLVKDDTFDIEEESDSWDFGSEGDSSQEDKLAFEPLGDEPPRLANSRFGQGSDFEREPALSASQPPRRNHPLLRLFEQSASASAAPTMSFSQRAAPPVNAMDTVRPTISIPSFDEMDEMASTSATSIELPADLLSPTTYKPNPFSWTKPTTFNRQEDDDRFGMGSGPFDEPDSDDAMAPYRANANPLSQSVGPSPSLPSISMNRPFQLGRPRADTAPNYNNNNQQAQMPSYPSAMSASAMDGPPRPPFARSHSSKSSSGSTGASGPRHGPNGSWGQESRPLPPTRSRTEIIIPASSDYSNRPFRPRLDSDAASRTRVDVDPVGHDQQDRFETRPRNFSDPRQNGRLNPGLTLSTLKPTKPGVDTRPGQIDRPSLMTAPPMLDNPFDFPTPVATGPAQQFAPLQDSYPFPKRVSAGRRSHSSGGTSLSSIPQSSTTTATTPSDSSMLSYRAHSSRTSMSSSDWPLGPPPRPLDYGALLDNPNRPGRPPSAKANIDDELKGLLDNMASWLTIVDDGLNRILSGTH